MISKFWVTFINVKMAIPIFLLLRKLKLQLKKQMYFVAIFDIGALVRFVKKKLDGLVIGMERSETRQ